MDTYARPLQQVLQSERLQSDVDDSHANIDNTIELMFQNGSSNDGDLEEVKRDMISNDTHNVLR